MRLWILANNVTRNMDPNEQLERLNDSRTQYHWAIANIVIALMCVALAALAFVAGYIVAGLLVLVVSVPLVVNADSHKKRGYRCAKEAA